ncbi:conserved hypothetical protein [Leishmania infantum JPCM5]|uniref:Uncharacterized protein n=2 Tax=Leishmania infantum TaxID=5671 RepID=A4I5K8_LEIIN|nr:conserved hypothetical protein [Leishmania infantum JPCM5]CAC9513840.1 Flagellar-associated_PapD-like/Zeta_toxin_-_putative [Leishmania infantum]CAM70078.1 conserved hypothetical protein [Leishmania infantum JPCM5]SUZ43996.1 Flagellar-associated_PapD-like/Zeta_toxin_-_putative [Leishmania infantum]|eukprot:XP_001467027.1 conserved hypothetical protein [Leishmania infantum JPCM5]
MRSSSPETNVRKAAVSTFSGPSSAPLTRLQKRFSSHAASAGREKAAALPAGIAAAVVGTSASFAATGSSLRKRSASKVGLAPHRPANAKCDSVVRVPPTHRQTNKWSAGTATLDALSTRQSPHAASACSPSFPFDVYPTQIFFDLFAANRTYTAALELRNHTTANTHVRVDRPSSCSGFELSAPHGAESSSKVAPGLSVIYTVVFSPTSNLKDYETQLVVRAESGEAITVPVRAYASRGQLQLPAALTLREAPVKGTSCTPLFLRNTSEQSCAWRAMVFDVSSVASEAMAKDTSYSPSSHFSITPSYGVVEPLCGGGDGTAVTVAPVTLHFHPHPSMAAASTFGAVLRFFLGPEGDVVQDVQLSAQAVELTGIALEQTVVTLADTYVTTERQTVVRLRNDSDNTVHFAWKSSYRGSRESDGDDDGSVAGDDAEFGGDGAASGGMTGSCAEKRMSDLTATADSSVYNGSSGGDGRQHQLHQPFHDYSTMRDDYTGDEAFRIEPLSGVLYGHGVREFTITFNPSVAVLYESIAFLDVTGLENRLPLTLRGHGLGPQCTLEYSRLEIGDVYLNALHEYEVSMENISSIECQYVIMPPLPVLPASAAAATTAEPATSTSLTDFSSKFRFTPSHGTLGPGEIVKLRIELQSDRIGSFSEVFRVHMQGAVEEVPLLLKGRVLGPHFQCSVEELVFGNVSYNMTHQRTMQIANTSPIPMHYTLRMPDECTYADDLIISPATGVIAPMATQTVTVTLHSCTVGNYDTALLVEVADVGDVLEAIPLKATCMVPPLFTNATELSFGGVFVGYPSTLNVAVLNNSALTGMFEFALVGGGALSDVVAVELPVSAEHEDGVHWISPHQTMQMPVTMTALRPGKLHFSIALRVLGMDPAVAPPQTILVSAVASGTHVEMQPSTFQFGTVDVLRAEVKELTLKNTSPVPAPFSLVFDRYGGLPATASSAAAASVAAEATLPFPREPVFTVEPAGGVLEPHSTLTVRIRAKPDEAMVFSDTLRLCHSPASHSAAAAEETAVAVGNKPTVTVKVAGKGIPIVSERPVADVKLGDVLTTALVAETITLHNYGRREQEVQWQSTHNAKTKERDLPPAFSYKPERSVIPAGGALTFTLSGGSDEPGVRTETFTLKQSGTFKEILRSTVSATFTVPTLSCSTRALHFDFANTEQLQALDAPSAASLVKSLTMKNVTSKTLAVSLRIRHAATASSSPSPPPAGASSAAANGVPFELEGPSTITFAPGDSYVVGIRCNPLYRRDFTSHTTKATVQFSFAHHARKEHVSLSATLRFPALVMNPSARLEFGSVLRNTEKRRTIVLSNPSADLPARFEWALQPQPGNSATAAPKAAGEGDVKAAEAQYTGDKSALRTIKAGDEAAAAAARCFDIVPYTGMLLPGESRSINVTYQGAECGTALATAVCRVHGGPTYTVVVHATSSVVQARCDRTEINFGRLPFYESATQSVMLSNSTLVPVTWDVDLRSMRHPECVHVSPVSGELREKARLLITFTPTVPDAFEETLWVRIGHLDPQPIHLRGSGYMNRLMITTTSSTASAVENEVVVYRAPFSAFTEALQYVESRLASSQLRSVYASRSVTPLTTTLATAASASESASNAPALPTWVQREWPTLEAERLAFCRAVCEAQASEHRCSVSPNGAIGPPLFLAPHALRRNSVTAVCSKDGTGAGTHKFVLARYVVDFGHLTRHDMRKVTLRLTNPSATEVVSAMLDSKELEHLPVSAVPMKGIKVGPLETTTLTLVMDATKPESLVRHGQNRYEFAIDVKHGPAIVVECRCYVATPTLRTAEKEVRFGPVLLGKVKVLPLVLTNPEAVPCPWRVTCKEEASSDMTASTAPRGHWLRDEQSYTPAGLVAAEPRGSIRSRRAAPASQFWVKKDHGVVEASGTTTIAVYFAPNCIAAEDGMGASEDRGSAPATATLRFRCGKGSAESVLTVKLIGSAFQYKVSLSTTQLQLPVVRPHQVVHESVTLTNNEEHPVEVYSLDLDTQHMHEIKLLRRAIEVNPDHEIFLPHLEAASRLPDALLESIFARLHAASESLKEAPPAADLEAAEEALVGAPAAACKGAKTSRGQSVSAASRASSSNSKGGRREKGKSGHQSAAAASGGIEKGLQSELAAADDIAGQDQGAIDGCTAVSMAKPSVVLLVGPPCSGKTTLAKQMVEWADAGSVIHVDVDEVIRREADRDDTADGAVARFLLSQLADRQLKSVPVTADDAAATGDAVAASYIACAPKLVRDALEGHLNRCIADHATHSAAGAASLVESRDFAASKPRKLLFLFDGLGCTVLQNPWLLFELLKETCDALHIPLQIVSLAVSTPMSGVRRAEALEAHHAARATAASLTLLSEAAFEALDKEAREDYTRRLKHFNDCRRDLRAAQQLKRNYMAQLPHKTVQQETEEAFTKAQMDLQQALALESTMRSARKGKAAAGAGRGAAQAAEGAKKLRELKWSDLDAATQFREWYTRFLTKYGTPPKPEGGDDSAIGAATARASAAGPPLKGAAAVAAAAAAEERANCWAAVVRVSAETETPSEVARVVELQLVQGDTETSSHTGAATTTLALPTLSPPLTRVVVATSSSAASGEGQLSVSARETDAPPAASSMAAVVESSHSPATAAAVAATSAIGEWLYLNKRRLRFWGNEALGGSRGVASVLGRPSSGEEVLAAKASTAVPTVAGVAETHTPLDAAGLPFATDAFHAGSAAVTREARYVHFFSTLEREVIPAKKSCGRGKTVPAVVQQEEELTRWWLPPKSSVTLTLEFCGDHVGPYTEKCLFGVVGTLQQLGLTVSTTVALSDISRDPKDIFPVIKARGMSISGGVEAGQRASKVYIPSRKLFDFGPLLIPPPPVPKSRRRSIEKVGTGSSSSIGGSGRSGNAGGGNYIHSSKAPFQHDGTLGEETLTFVNREASEAEVTLSFLNEKEKTFVVTPTSFVLKPGASQQVSLRATPEKVGDFTNTLLACIKDNPLPWRTDVTCMGARPTLTVNGCKDLEVNFGRLVLNRSVTKSFSLVNEGPLPLQWRLVPVLDGMTTRGPGGGGSGVGGAASGAAAAAAAQLPTELQCSALEGVIEEGGTYTLNMTFAPTHPCFYTRSMLFTVSYPGHPHQVLYESLPVIIKAEGYDVVLEWTREIQLGVLHVGEEKHDTIRILNKSPYEVGYQLKLPKRLQKSVTLSSPSGTLRGMVGFKDAAVVNIDIVARLEKEGELPAKLSLIEVAFFDVDRKELLYPVQSIPVTGEAWYTKYAVQPPSVSFGSCLIGQPRESTFELRNTGVFPLEYVLFNYRDAAAEGSANENVADASTAGGAAVAAAPALHAPSAGAKNQIKAAKGSEMDVIVGAFKCCPCRGIIPVGGAQIITVSTVPRKQSRTRETIGVRVVQSGPELERYGTPVEVSAYPALPSIAADLTSSADVETIFEEQRVVYRLDQLAKGVCAYSKEERVFSFGTTLVGQRSEERFRIANSSPLPCTIVAHLEGASVTGTSGNSGSGNAARGNASAASSGNKPVTGGGGGGGASAAAGGAGKVEGFDLSLDGSGASPAQTRMTTVKMVLPPYESRFLTIGFTPGSLRRFQAQIVAVAESAAISSDDMAEAGQELRFGLCGEGTLPSVEVEVPPRLSSSAVPWGSSGGRKSSGACAGSMERMHRRTESGGSTSSNERKRGLRRSGGGSGGSTSPSVYGSADGYSTSSGVAEVLELPLARVGAVASRSFTLRNIGCVTAKVHLELMTPGGDDYGTPNSALKITTRGGTGGTAVKKQRGALAHHRAELFVPAGQSEVVELTYAPTQVETTTTRMRVLLRDNPFEEKEVHILAYSFDSPISFDGIDPSSPDHYDIGDCWIGVDKSCTFTVRNNTDSLVRYDWQYPDAVVRMVPSVGHLSAGATRTITVVVRSESQNLNQVARCTIQVQSIQLLTNALGGGLVHSSIGDGGAASGGTGSGATPVSGATNAAITEWDNSMQSPKWVLREDDTAASAIAAGAHSAAATAAFLSTAASMVGRRNLKQVLEPLPEPPYAVVDAVNVMQSLTLRYHCSVPAYQCQLVDAATGAVTDLKAISFEQTYLMQKRVAIVRVINTGSVGLPLTYDIATSGEEDGAPTRTASQQNLKSPHARRGDSGALAAGVVSGTSLFTPAVEGDAGALHESPGYTAPTADFAVVPSPTSRAASTIPVGTHLDLHVEFTPRAVGLIMAELILSMRHSDPAEMRVPLQGVAECPLVHFNVPPTTYSDTRSMAGISGAAYRGQDTVVVEFLARGLHTKATVKFPVMNPTATTYSYEWVEEGMGRGASANGGASGGSVSPFRCLTPMGTIAAGRQAEATFEFYADTLGVRESAWSFQIPGRAAIPFVLVGTAVEPNVYFHASKVIFGHVQVGTQVEQTVVLENCDDVPFSFSWDKFSMEGTSSFLSVRPLRGTIAPHERLLATVTFSPQDEVEYNVPLRCTVKRSSVPLSINVKGVGVSVHDSLQVEPIEDGAEPTLMVRGQPLFLNLDRVQVNSTVERRFALRNTGAYPFQYSVEAPENSSVSVEGMEGKIAAKQTGVIVFRYHPTCEETLKQCRLLFRIEGKVAYKVGIKATAYMPRLQLSFDHYDFGPRFILAYNNGSATAASGVAMTVLQLTNLESEVVSVDCSVSAHNVWCRLDSTTLVVRPKESARLRLTFVPPEARQYNDNLRLCFNALHTVLVPITGEGVVPRVEVVNPFAKLGIVRIGETRQMEVKLMCLSKIPTPISFAQSIDDDLLQKGFSVSLPERTPAAAAAATPLAIMLKPKESATVVLSFAPTQRMGEFSREVKMLVCGVEVPFLSVSGSCADAEVHLDTSALSFRDVVVGASASRRVSILNSGDISQKFSWLSSLQKLRPQGEWSIFPSSGYVRAHTELSCELRYTPSLPSRGNTKAAAAPASSALMQQILTVELDSSPGISLTIESNCVTRPAATETVHFACRARETDVKMIEVYNPTEETWTTEPVLDNSLWTCPAQLTLKPKAKSMLTVTYQPVRPTSTAAAAAAAKFYSNASNDLVTDVLSSKDKATLFIPLPDGTGRCVALEGIAEAAGSAGPVQEYDGVVQVSLPLYFQIRNWSTTEIARFRREVEWNSVTRTGDNDSGQLSERISTLIHVEGDDVGDGGRKGTSSARSGRPSNRSGTAPKAPPAQNAIEVPPGASRESVLTVTPLCEGVYRGTVRFVPVDGPSDAAAADVVQFYDFVIRVRPVEVSVPTTVDLHAALRELASFAIPLTNPLSKPAVFKLEVGAADGTASPTTAAASAAPETFTFPPTVTVPAHTHAEALVQFFPLIPKPPATVRCTVTSAELGSTTVYDFRLLNTCDVAAPERMTRLVCPLGQHTNFVLRFKHYSKTNTEFSIRVSGETLGKGTATFTRVGAGGGGSQAAVVKVNACPQPPATSTSLVSKGQDVAVEFSYEPSELGEAVETIEFVSPVAGTYTFPIVANCTLPERQGPFVARLGQNVQLPLKNVFSEPVAVTVTSDSPFFVPSRKTETIAAHKTANVIVHCKPEDGVEVIRGRVTITCVPPGKPAPNQTQQPIQWVYYVEAANSSDRSSSVKQSKAKK